MLVLVGPARAQDITVYRCTDASGRVSLQDEPCPAGQAQQQRSMVQPKDPPPRPAGPAPAASALPSPPPSPVPAPAPLYLPPPPIYQCTTYDGDTRFSENPDPNPRCVPLAVLGYDAGPFGAACRWVEDSCVRLDDASACEVLREKLDEAESDALHAFSDTAAYRDSEVLRLKQIVRESCR
ncbi:DUF4124 domain-containing protein [Arenimonas sp.]|uniref:DUF4124 domain-containing protein n=1 Tax=Arenimonas sp. TaxID=1872635 RepID=UPI0035B4B0AA